MDPSFVEALSSYVDEDYETAERALSELIDGHGSHRGGLESDQHEELFNWAIKRSATRFRLSRFLESKEDAMLALGMKPEHPVALMRAGVALMHIGELQNALKYLKRAVDGSKNPTSSLISWLQICESKLKNVMPLVSDSTKLGASDSNSIECSLNTVTESESDVKKEGSRLPPKCRVDWYQSSSHTTIDIRNGVKLANFSEDNVKYEFGSHHVVLRLRYEEFEDTVFRWNVYDEIVPEHSSAKIIPRKIELRLKKRNEASAWPFLEKQETSNDSIRNTASTVASCDAPQSAYSSKKNWNAIEKELEDDEPQGEEALSSLFKKIYANADEDTRRAMVKSMQTSGGTVLSTNWNEVSQKNYETNRPAPKGMQWKSWEGENLDVGESDDATA